MDTQTNGVERLKERVFGEDWPRGVRGVTDSIPRYRIEAKVVWLKASSGVIPFSVRY